MTKKIIESGILNPTYADMYPEFRYLVPVFPKIKAITEEYYYVFVGGYRYLRHRFVQLENDDIKKADFEVVFNDDIDDHKLSLWLLPNKYTESRTSRCIASAKLSNSAFHQIPMHKHVDFLFSVAFTRRH